MPTDGQNVTTSIDDLVKYINEHGETDSFSLSQALGVSEAIIEVWAGALEKAKLMRVLYKRGKMYLAPADKA